VPDWQRSSPITLARTPSADSQGALADARRQLSVAGAARGTLHVHGIWLDPAATRLTITGQLDGHQVNTSVPAA
jgi:hypothetical protein